MARCMMHAQKYVLEFRAKVVCNVVYRYYPCLTRVVQAMMPKEARSGEKPSIIQLHMFEYIVYAKVPNEKRT